MSKATEDRLLDIIEYFIGMNQAPTRAPQEGFSQPEVRTPGVIPMMNYSTPTDEEEQAEWEYRQGLITQRELEKALANSDFINTEIELTDDVAT